MIHGRLSPCDSGGDPCDGDLNSHRHKLFPQRRPPSSSSSRVASTPMAEAGSSGLQSAGSNVTATRSDFGFPDLDGSQPQHRSTRPERTTNMNTLGLGYPSSSRRPSSGGRISSLDSNSSRRRVRSMPGDDDVFPPGPSRLRHIHDMEVEPHRRVASLTRRGTGKQRAAINLLGNAEGHLDYPAAPFSEEYDLCTFYSTLTSLYLLCSSQHMKVWREYFH